MGSSSKLSKILSALVLAGVRDMILSEMAPLFFVLICLTVLATGDPETSASQNAVRKSAARGFNGREGRWQ